MAAYDESWEFQNNTSARMLFKSDDFDEIYTDPETGDTYPAWKNDFEARFPEDTYEDITQLKAFISWVVSTDRDQATGAALPETVTYGETEYTNDTADYRLAKFKAEFADYAETDSFIFYYIFTELFLMVDSRAKNFFLGFHGSECEIEGMRRKAVAEPYDMDTAIGTNNEGSLVFSYDLEDTDHLEGGANIFNGQDSVLWCNLRDTHRSEISQMYKTLRSNGVLAYGNVEAQFEAHQSKWPEALLNEDSWIKYITPLTAPDVGKEPTAVYLPMMQGPKKEQRKWWLYNRFQYEDSKYNAGDALNEVIQLRGYAKDDITVTPYAAIYPTVKYGSYLVQKRGSAGTPTTLECPVTTLNDTEIYIYSAKQIASIGDVSGLKVGFADFSMATHLQEIKVGDASSEYQNGNLNDLELGSNALLRKLDARNCTALGTGKQKSVDMSGCVIIEEAYFDGTKVQGLTLPVGGVLKKLHLPDTMTNITIRNQRLISEFVCAGYSNVTTLRLENNSSAIDERAILHAIPSGARVRLVGFYWECTDAADIEATLDLLDTMRGLDENGNNVEKAQVSGTIHTATLTGEQVASYNARYPFIAIVADSVLSYRTYADWDETVIKVVECHDGVPQEAAPTGLTRANSSDGHYSYTFAGWALEPDAQAADPSALDNVIADRTVYAAYTWNVRTYTVAWNNSNGTRLETDENVPWGTTPAYNGSTPQNPSGSAPFTKWTPDIAKVTGNATYTASYTPVWKVYFYLDSTHLDATVDVLDGGTAVYPNGTPAHPTDPDSYEFTGWSPTPTNVRGNLSVYAQWKRTAAKWETPGFDVSGAYAVQWHYGLEMPQLARGGAAAAFSNPVPAEGTSGSGSSPFDSIAPWNGMEIYVDVNGTPQKYAAGMNLTENDILVKIPEFYYKAEKDTTKQMWTWAVSPTAKTGYEKHPGSGRYVGRYHTGGSSSGVYSRSGVSPLVNTSQTNFRTYSANKGTGWHMMDLATWSAIQLLYLVEFADFDSQTVLGKGWNTGSIGSMGGTDSASYHTVKATGAHNQYRNIEDPFSNCCDWIDGFVGSNNSDTYAAAKDSYAGGNSDLTALGFKLPSSGAIRGFGYSATAPWAFIPDTASGTDYTTYVCDRVYSVSSLCPAYVGGSYGGGAGYGFFYFYAFNSASSASGYLGSRLLKT